jgi:hypothetical protein
VEVFVSTTEGVVVKCGSEDPPRGFVESDSTIL